MAHCVERVADHDDHCVGGGGDRLAGHLVDDLHVDAEQVVAAHAGLARHAGGDHHDFGASGRFVVGRAADGRVHADDGAGLVHIERLALGQALDDVDQDDIGVAALGQPLGGRRAHIARPDDGHLGAHSAASFLSMFRMFAGHVPALLPEKER